RLKLWRSFNAADTALSEGLVETSSSEQGADTPVDAVAVETVLHQADAGRPLQDPRLEAREVGADPILGAEPIGGYGHLGSGPEPVEQAPACCGAGGIYGVDRGNRGGRGDHHRWRGLPP